MIARAAGRRVADRTAAPGHGLGNARDRQMGAARGAQGDASSGAAAAPASGVGGAAVPEARLGRRRWRPAASRDRYGVARRLSLTYPDEWEETAKTPNRRRGARCPGA